MGGREGQEVGIERREGWTEGGRGGKEGGTDRQYERREGSLCKQLQFTNPIFTWAPRSGS